MKVLFLNTCLFGGAAKGAKGLFDLVSGKLDEPSFCYIAGNSKNDKRFLDYSNKYWYNKFGSKKISRIVGDLIASPGRKDFLKKFVREDSCSLFSYPETVYNDMRLDADIIHLNWVANFIDYPTFFKNNKNIKMVWTLRDMNPFTAGCHYADECDQFISGCKDCPQLKASEMSKDVEKIFRIKEEGLSHIDSDNLKIICPSKWVMKESSKSRLLGRFEHIHISHGVDTSKFKVKDKSLCREKLNLDKKSKIVLFVSDSVKDVRKGMPLLMRSLKNIGVEDLVLVSVGNESADSYIGDLRERVKYMHLGFIKENDLLSDIYNSADVFVTPSMAESFGFTIAESLCCGTPVIAFETTAITEKIDNAKNGYLVKLLDEKDLSDKINHFFQRGVSLSRSDIFDLSVNKYSQSSMAESYYELYKNLLEKTQ